MKKHFLLTFVILIVSATVYADVPFGLSVSFGTLGSTIQKWALNKQRAKNLEKILVSQFGFKAGSVQVRHIKNNLFGVWVKNQIVIGDDVIDQGWHKDKKTPVFYMVLNENTNKFQFPSNNDKKEAIRYRKVSNGDMDALLE